MIFQIIHSWMNDLLLTTLSTVYYKTRNVCGIKISRFNENEIFEHFNFGGHDTPRLQIIKKIEVHL